MRNDDSFCSNFGRLRYFFRTSSDAGRHSLKRRGIPAFPDSEATNEFPRLKGRVPPLLSLLCSHSRRIEFRLQWSWPFSFVLGRPYTRGSVPPLAPLSGKDGTQNWSLRRSSVGPEYRGSEEKNAISIARVADAFGKRNVVTESDNRYCMQRLDVSRGPQTSLQSRRVNKVVRSDKYLCCAKHNVGEGGGGVGYPFCLSVFRLQRRVFRVAWIYIASRHGGKWFSIFFLLKTRNTRTVQFTLFFLPLIFLFLFFYTG